MKRPREDSGGESDDEATEQSRGPSVSLEGGDVTSQGEEGNLPAVEMDVERGEGGEGEPQGEREIPEQRGRARREEMYRREAEEDLRFKDDLDTRRSRQEGEVIDSLQNLTLKCVSDNTKYFRSQSKDIHSLPGPLFRLVADHLLKNADETELPDILPLVISEKTWELKLRFSSSVWTPESVAKAFEVIEEKCKHTLTHLELVVFNQLLPMNINTILASLENLTTLTIHRGTFGVTDDTLLVLGQNCLKLRYLIYPLRVILRPSLGLPDLKTLLGSYFRSMQRGSEYRQSIRSRAEQVIHSFLQFLALDNSKQITDTGIDYLCARAAPYGQCKNLETLDIEGTSVSVDGLVTALSNLPNLKVLRHEKLLPALDKFVKINGVTKKLQLIELDCTGNAVLAPSDLENVCKIIPHATTVKVEYVGSLCAFFNVNAISIFELRFSDISLPELNSFITHFSSSLTKFTMMYCDSKIDLSVFGSCPNLEVLYLSCGPNLSTNQFQLLPSSFMKLKELTIFPTGLSNRTNLELDVPDLMQMLSSPTLCILRLGNITLSEASLYSLIVEAKENQTVFSNLECFQITQNEYSLDTLKQLICVCPKLSYFNCSMFWESKLQLGSFLLRNILRYIFIAAS